MTGWKGADMVLEDQREEIPTGGAHENHRRQDLGRRQPAARHRRPLFHLRQAHHRRRRRRLWRGLQRHLLGPCHRADDRGHGRALSRRPRPARHRDLLPPLPIRRASRSAPTFPAWAASRRSKSPAGTSSARRPASRSTSCSAARCTRRCAPTPTSIRIPAASTPRMSAGKNVYNDPDLAAECAARYVEQGFNAVKLDPAGPYTAFDGHQPRLDRHRPVGPHGEGDPRGGRHQGRHPVRHAWPVHRVGRAAHGARHRALRSAVVRGAGAARHAGSDGAGGARHVDPDRHRRAADHQIRVRPRHREPRRRPSCSPISAAPAASSKPRRSRPWPRPTTSRSRRTAIAGRSSARPTSSLPSTLPNFLILESLKQWDGFHAKLLKKKIEWQDGNVIPSKEPGLGVELDEAVCEAHP